MPRFGRILQLREGKIEGYEKHHANVWPGFLDAVARSGISNYSIFRYNRLLFSYFELPEGTTLEQVN